MPEAAPAEVKTVRPLSITIFCVFAFIGVFPTVFLVFSPLAQAVGSWYPPFLGFSGAVGLTCAIGLWMMRRWAAYLYAGMLVVNQVVLIVTHTWNPLSILIPGIFLYFILKHHLRMS